MLSKLIRIVGVALLLAYSPAASAQSDSQSYDSELQLGVAAYKNNHFEEAMTHFRRATELDPSQLTAHIYLATAYVSQYIPGVESPDNRRLADQAIEQYQRVLDGDADRTARINSTKGMAYLYLNMKKFEEAKEYYQKASGLDPQDPENYYSLGVIDWTACYSTRMQARAKLNMAPGDNLDSRNPGQKKVCEQLKVNNSSSIEDGIDNLNKAIQLRSDYDDAMAYMNLMYRERADLECDNPVARENDLRTADEWVDKTLAVKKTKAEKTRPASSTTAPNPQ